MRLYSLPLLATAALAIPYSEYILAPSSRTLTPPSIYRTEGSVSNASSLLHENSTTPTTLHGKSSITFDFQKNIAGLVSLDVSDSSASDAFIGVTFSESSLYVSSEACDATADAGLDSPLWFNVGAGSGVYTAEEKHVRGGFRYMTIVSNTTADVSLNSVTVNFTAAPKQDLTAYTGYFHCDDELLNRIWYAGAYTNQLCTIDPEMGNSLVWYQIINKTQTIELPETVDWWSNYTISNGSSVLTDGAKRDRLVWPGDMSVQLEVVGVSTYDLYSMRNALERLLVLQKADGRLPYASPPYADTVSFTYHCQSLVGIYFYYLYSGDRAWLARHWTQFKLGVDWALGSVDDSGLANITASSDWLRFGMGGHNIEANAILYYTLNQGLTLSSLLNDTTPQQNWTRTASRIKSSANHLLWDASAGLYIDNQTTTMHPQDGNVWAIKANLTNSTTQSTQLTRALRSRWGPYGAPAPEAGATVSPFISSLELQAHFMASDAQSALDLMRRSWGFMLDDPRMTNSTFIEGFSTNGSLHYEPYANDPRVSHAHGWATGPTSALTHYAAGLRITKDAGQEWEVAPQPGDLKSVHAGFETVKGQFAVRFERESNATEAGYRSLELRTPRGTVGTVRLPGVEGELVSGNGTTVRLRSGKVSGLEGGNWRLVRR
ncbi:Six-hairpin glycosidase [Aspergillus steynii IBT 23096]|uniref:Six-hairpin glycosidase n=1 Tax=Aspergillus steynii IBT 23096 TaxID=1392250 RepID=A0A2I2GCM9_9EURO|nr:Six-hairpin glycosidase [Aspergillus steynii IBT 23096]PLB50646.1 Six-hairpin glycosidase [Aspergillus steynii IBT 23096]